jgi:DNA-binding transcriptional LysR family regulator
MEILRRVERIGEKLSADEDDLTGQIRVLTVTHLALPELDHALRQMRRRHPSVSIRIDVAHSQDIVRAVAQKQAPFGLCLLPKPLAALNCRFLMREEFGIYCGQTHPMYGRIDVSLDELRQEAFVAFTCSQEGGALEPMISLRDGAGLGAWTVGSSPHLEEVRRLIAAGLGIGILPIDAAKSIEPEQLWLVPTLRDALGADVYFVTNPDLELGAAETAFLDIFSTALFDAQVPSEGMPA